MSNLVDMTYDSRPDTFLHIAEVRGLLNLAIHDLLDRGHVHDQSKLEDPELEMFDRVTPLLRELTYGSEEYERARVEMGPALQHHYACNSHHPESHAKGIRGMTLIDLIEMICDWMAASRRHDDGDIRDSVEKNQDRFRYSDEMKEILLNTISVIESKEVARV